MDIFTDIGEGVLYLFDIYCCILVFDVVGSEVWLLLLDVVGSEVWLLVFDGFRG